MDPLRQSILGADGGKAPLGFEFVVLELLLRGSRRYAESPQQYRDGR